MTPLDPHPSSELPIDAQVVSLVESLLQKLSLAGTVTCRNRLHEQPPHLWIDIETKESGLLIGERGMHLRAFEHIVRLLIHREMEHVSWRCVVDVNGYRLRRIETLKRLARNAARRVMTSHHAVTLEPMPAIERRIVHLALTGEALVETSSIGQGADRRVVIRPRDPFLVPEQGSRAPQHEQSIAP